MTLARRYNTDFPIHIQTGRLNTTYQPSKDDHYNILTTTLHPFLTSRTAGASKVAEGMQNKDKNGEQPERNYRAHDAIENKILHFST